jgi:Lipocalin-like domain
MQVIGTADGRAAPHDSTPTDEERVELYDTMFAYAGTYSFDARSVTHHVDISWNEAWTGTDQVRFYEIQRDTLNITSRAIDPTQREAQYILIWERIR